MVLRVTLEVDVWVGRALHPQALLQALFEALDLPTWLISQLEDLSCRAGTREDDEQSEDWRRASSDSAGRALERAFHFEDGRKRGEEERLTRG